MANGKHSALVRLLSLALVAVVLVSFVMVSTSLAHAAPAQPSSSRCVVTYFHLNGNQPPTVTCLLRQQAQGVTPNISQTLCNGPGWFTLYTGNHVATWCFGGGGSMSIGLPNVTGYSAGNNWGGFLWDGMVLECFQKYKSVTRNFLTVNYLWLYENPYDEC